MNKKKKIFQVFVALCVGLIAAIANYAFLSSQKPQKLTIVQVRKELHASSDNNITTFSNEDFQPFDISVLNNKNCIERNVFVLWENRYAFFDQPIKRNMKEGEFLLVADLDDLNKFVPKILGPFYFENSLSDGTMMLKNRENDQTSEKDQESLKKELENANEIYSIIRCQNKYEINANDTNFQISLQKKNRSLYQCMEKNQEIGYLKEGDWIYFVVEP